MLALCASESLTRTYACVRIDIRVPRACAMLATRRDTSVISQQLLFFLLPAYLAAKKQHRPAASCNKCPRAIANITSAHF